MLRSFGDPGAPDGEAIAADCASRERIAQRYRAVRRNSEVLVEPLESDDYLLQAAPFVSPAKWHLAHVSWFFETFLTGPFLSGYQTFQPQFAYLFNSYYNAVGPQFPRPQRGLLSRPTVEEVMRYRRYVDQAMDELLATAGDAIWRQVAARTLLGCAHEEQHQELLLTDLKYNLALNPLAPAYRADLAPRTASSTVLRWQECPGGDFEIGHPGGHPTGAGGDGFAFDNETPRHHARLDDYAMATRPVSNGEYRSFIDDGGYRRPDLWLSDGWAAVCDGGWQAPLYWSQEDGEWWTYTLGGRRRVDDDEPVCHVGFYEAEAFARWSGVRLPSEAEWEAVAQRQPVRGNLREKDVLHPAPGEAGDDPIGQLFGDVWEWTASAYQPYPRYRPAPGALGEYNGKFMCNQVVLRGGSCVTPQDHLRASYRNFFYPADRWQFSGIRLAKDL
jgi:ergothioneine biosynthesis protein EgtB